MNRIFSNAACALFLPVMLVSCADLQNQRTEAAAAQAKEQCRQLYGDARLDRIRDKVPVQMRIEEPIPVQMMSNSNLPTEEEKTAILVWAEQRQLCQQGSNSLVGAQPAHVEAIRSANSQAMADL